MSRKNLDENKHKLSVDISGENKEVLDILTSKLNIKYGPMINKIISTFCRMPENTKRDIESFCLYRYNFLSEAISNSEINGDLFWIQAYEEERETYLNILKLMNGGIFEPEANVLSQEPLGKPKTYVANYLFNYFGGDIIEDKNITGAGIDVAIRPYKDGKPVQFRSEEETYFSLEIPSKLFGKRIENIYLTSMISVSFDRKNLYKIDINVSIMKLICEHFGWNTIEVEVVDFELDYIENEWISVPWYCGKEVFVKFITDHLDEFDITDNIHVHHPAYSWLDE